MRPIAAGSPWTCTCRCYWSQFSIVAFETLEILESPRLYNMTNSQTNCKPIITITHHELLQPPAFRPCLSFGWSWVQHHLHPPKPHQKADGQTWVSLPDHLGEPKDFVLLWKDGRSRNFMKVLNFSAIYVYFYSAEETLDTCDDICLLLTN